MPNFNVGDNVTLGPRPTSQRAFRLLTPGRVYAVEKTAPTCSSMGCPNPGTGTIRILGTFFCAECFVPAGIVTGAGAGAQAIPGTVSGAVYGGKSKSGVQERSKDPARALNASEVDEYDCFPDPTPEERVTLPTYEQMNDEWWKKRGYPDGSPTKKLP